MEKVLCIKKDSLTKILGNPLPQGAFKDLDLKKLFNLPYEFISRDIAENDPAYKQIIPYQIIKSNDKIFVYERNSKASEKRLHKLLSIGIGGHINESDIKDIRQSNLEDILYSSIIREREEELRISNIIGERFIGWINDDSQAVGQVHLGLVFLIEISSKEGIEVKEIDNIKSISWWIVDQIKENRDRFETWSILALSLL